MGSTIVREEAMFIPATMKKIQHVEHAYECKSCKGNSFQNTQIKRGQAQAPIQRSLTSPSILAKVIYDKFIQYIPLCRKEWERCGLFTNDKNWVIRTAQDWLLPVYERMKEMMMKKTILHVMKHTEKLFIVPMGNQEIQMPITGCIAVCLVKDRLSFFFKMRYPVVFPWHVGHNNHSVFTILSPRFLSYDISGSNSLACLFVFDS